jgi:small GTP-binding protein
MNLFQSINKWFNVKIFGDSGTTNSKEYKLLILGDKGVGKTSVCNRFLKNEFNLEVKSTTQSECFMKELFLLEHIIHLYIIDINEHILSNDRSHLYSNVNGAIILFDITKSKSFEGIDKWIIDLKQNTSNNLPILIVGNKSDLSFLRNIDYEEGLHKAISYNCDYFETTCIEDKSVEESFKIIVARIYYNEMSNEQKNMVKLKLYQAMSQEENKTEVKKQLENIQNFKLDDEDELIVSNTVEKMQKSKDNKQSQV